MPHYVVSVTRIAPQTLEFEVEAPNKKLAKLAAIDEANNTDFSDADIDSEYRINSVERVED